MLVSSGSWEFDFLEASIWDKLAHQCLRLKDNTSNQTFFQVKGGKKPTVSAMIHNQLDNRQTILSNYVNSINIYWVEKGQTQCWVDNSNTRIYDTVSELKWKYWHSLCQVQHSLFQVSWRRPIDLYSWIVIQCE